MLKLLRQLILFVTIFVSLIGMHITHIQAQAISQAVALAISLTETATEGDIIVLTDQGYQISTNSTQSNIVGVVNFNPPVLIKDKSFEGSTDYTPVITSGLTQVKVTNSNGDIKTGDLITVSSVKGSGEKSTIAGYVLGKALQDYTSDQIGKINVLVDIYFNTIGTDSGTDTQTSGIFGLFQISAAEVYKEPAKALRYLIAAIIIIASFIFGFASFGSIARNGIEALGRNPLASGRIQIGIFFNSLVAISIIAAGVLFAVIIAIF